MDNRTVESKTAAEYLDPKSGPEPSEETGLGTHFANTFDRSLKKQAPEDVADAGAATVGARKTSSVQQKLAATSSTMTTAQLQKAAKEDDPNALRGGK